MLALGAVYGVTLVPGVRSAPGYRAALDWWLNMTVDALVILVLALRVAADRRDRAAWLFMTVGLVAAFAGDRKSTRLNSSHANISYAVFCLKKQKLLLTPIVCR